MRNTEATLDLIIVVLIIALVIMLTGCSTAHYREVKIAIPVHSKPVSLPPKPYLPIYNLTVKSTPDDVMKAYVASLMALNDYVDAILSMQPHLIRSEGDMPKTPIPGK